MSRPRSEKAPVGAGAQKRNNTQFTKLSSWRKPRLNADQFVCWSAARSGLNHWLRWLRIRGGLR